MKDIVFLVYDTITFLFSHFFAFHLLTCWWWWSAFGLLYSIDSSLEFCVFVGFDWVGFGFDLIWFGCDAGGIWFW